MKININQLPSIAFENVKKLPKQPGVYIALSGSDQILYVGQSKNLYNRWRSESHHRHSQLRDHGCQRLCFILCQEVALKTLEEYCIEEFKPKLNNSRVMEDAVFLSLALPKSVANHAEKIAADKGMSIAGYVAGLIGTDAKHDGEYMAMIDDLREKGRREYEEIRLNRKLIHQQMKVAHLRGYIERMMADPDESEYVKEHMKEYAEKKEKEIMTPFFQPPIYEPVLPDTHPA